MKSIIISTHWLALVKVNPILKPNFSKYSNHCISVLFIRKLSLWLFNLISIRKEVHKEFIQNMILLSNCNNKFILILFNWLWQVFSKWKNRKKIEVHRLFYWVYIEYSQLHTGVSINDRENASLCVELVCLYF